jgi:hypothetical protein
MCIRVAVIYTCFTLSAGSQIPGNSFVRYRQSPLWASIHANATTDTFIGYPFQLRFDGKGLRIVTPFATQITTLEENRCPYTISVMQRQSLNMRNCSFTLSHLYF